MRKIKGGVEQGPKCDTSRSRQRPLVQSANQSRLKKTVDVAEIMESGGGRQMYKCLYCGKLLVTKGGLEEHIKSHEGVFRYMCEFCDKGFQTRDHFNGHMNAHVGRKPFQCQFCEKSFSYRMSLARHQASCDAAKY